MNSLNYLKFFISKKIVAFSFPSFSGARRQRVRLSIFSIVGILAVFGFLAASFSVVVGDYARVQVSRLHTYIKFKRVRNERDHLHYLNRGLSTRLEELLEHSTEQSRENDFLQKRLGEVFSVLEDLSEYGLESENIKPGSSPEEAVGGAEIDCESSLSSRCGELDLISEEGIKSQLLQKGNLLSDRLILLRALPLTAPGLSDTTSRYGWRRSPFSRTVKMHQGIDFRATSGTDIRVTGDGVVKKVGRTSTYGLYIDIDHGNNIISRYAHLSKALIRQGEAVSRGRVIAHSGSSGRVTGPHLHYEIRENGRAVNPLKYLRAGQKLAKILKG